MTDAHNPDDHTGSVLYEPPEWAPVPGAMYPRATRLEHGEGDDPALLATFECYETVGKTGTDEPYFPIYRSTDDGRSWSHYADLRDTEHGWGLRYQPTLFELPQQVGPWEAGTVLAAGNAIPSDRSETSIDLYASDDGGRNWSFVSTIVSGGKAVPSRGESPVWVPELTVDADGNLVCYFSDERHSEDGYDRLIGHRVSSDGGNTWEPQVFDVAIADNESRPGMPSVTPLPNGRYLMTYYIDGPQYGGSVFTRTSPNGREWGDPADVGAPVQTTDELQLIDGPYGTWVPAGDDNGTILVAGKTFRDKHRNPAPDSGTVLLATTDMSAVGPWTPVSAPLWFDDELETGHRSVAWTTTLLPAADGTELLQFTSTYAGHGKTEIRYGRESLSTMVEYDRDSSERSASTSSTERSQSAHRRTRENTQFISRPTDSTPPAEPHHVKSIVKAFDLLETIERTGPVGVTELARQTGVAKSSVYKYLDTLRHLGYVTKSDGEYATSLRLFRFGQQILSRHEVRDIAKPELQALSERIGETVSLIVEEDGDAVYLYCTDPVDGLTTIEAGSRLPIHVSTGGKALLAHRSREEVDSLLENAVRTVDRQNFYADLETARDNRVLIDRDTSTQLEYSAGLLEKQEYTISQQRADDRIHRIAVPIRDGEDRGVAALEVIGSNFELDSTRLQADLVPLLVAAAKEIELELLERERGQFG
ncbi:helix-turn-helix domain-containing protein [Natronolimnobius sp. AArcel1]|uniref:IclR family transcriptional regulator domain-containing protein n=1 Tax=Natronolimnobius sp. AArcel1 TaxID=1679093 RepID=UPI0013ED957C|nr:helix-turn-helix domain-containing protein [Natronolimnobius sp. AArcel1]NGM69137.1 helix-turn-helix domain-containing protein [Natronolimnobius sp. AArcel1]